MVHDFGGPIGLPLALTPGGRVRRVVVLNSWMWSFAGDAQMERAGKIAGSAVGRFLYRWANLSQRVVMPSAYGDRAKLSPAIHRQYLSVFPDGWSRDAVLWTLARELLGSSAYYARLWSERELLRAMPVLIVWGMRDSAFKPDLLAPLEGSGASRAGDGLPVGHWPTRRIRGGDYVDAGVSWVMHLRLRRITDGRIRVRLGAREGLAARIPLGAYHCTSMRRLKERGSGTLN